MNEAGNVADRTARTPLRDYRPPVGFDEFLYGSGEIREAWSTFAAVMNNLDQGEISQRWNQAERLVGETGLLYNPYGNPDEAARPWEVDCIPLLIGEQDWQRLSEGLIQRAHLINKVLKDLYGPQQLIHSGLLPSELVYANPAFVRAFHELPTPGDHHLCVYAVDLARGSNGDWWVTADRTDAPLGVGYAIENRLLLARTFPQLFHGSQVERLAGFFRAMRDRLYQLAPRHRENPRAVLLTEGPQTTNYFEDIYLARYLGIALVEGADLAVRDEHVSLKTLGGLLPVDVIFRRSSEMFADPLEMGSSAAQGVAGLLQAIRAGNVAVVNQLGCGLLESAAFLPFLPTLSESLLGEPLKLPTAATWWCGQESALQYVLENLDHLHLRNAFRVARRDGGERLNQLPIDERSARIRSAPHHYVAYESISRSTAPTWNEGRIEPGHVALRAYLVAENDSFIVMPGGLVRVAKQPISLDRSILGGERSKDVWVLSTQPVSSVSLLSTSERQVKLKRGGAELPSRVADNVFWLGRYLERCEGTARLLRTIVTRITSEWEEDVTPELVALVRMAAFQGAIEPGFAVEELRELLPEIDQAMLSSVVEDHPGSLQATLGALHRLTSNVRDRLSQECWQIINGIHRDVQAIRESGSLDGGQVLGLLNRVIVEMAAMVGMVMENTTRTLEWRFLDGGRRIERSVYIAALLQNSLIDADDADRAVMESIVEVADSTMTYRSRYLTSWQTSAVLDLLLTDDSNPRSLAFQLVALNDHVNHLPRDPEQVLRSPAQRIIMSLLNSVLLADVEQLTEVQKGGKRAELDRLLSRQLIQLPKLAQLIANQYLVHAGKPRQMGRN